MKTWVIILVLILVLAYIFFVIHYMQKSQQRKEAEILLDTVTKRSNFKTFHFEDEILQKMKVNPEKVKLFIYLERTLVFLVILFAFYFLRGIALALFGAIIITVIADQAYKKVIYESGITNINKITNFINYFVPHINSGNSADQSFLGYIEYSADEELAAYYENIDNPEYEIPPHLKQIIDIYDIAKYNEEKGISDYTYILNELSEDMAQKQVYYNSFVSRIGEIQPICWSYYFSIPILIFVSFQQTHDFWMGIGGYIVAIVLLILFGAFKFLIYKLQKKTIEVIF